MGGCREGHTYILLYFAVDALGYPGLGYPGKMGRLATI